MVHNDNGISFFCRGLKFTQIGAASLFFEVGAFVFFTKGIQKSDRNFFITPLFPLEIFAQNEKY